MKRIIAITLIIFSSSLSAANTNPFELNYGKVFPLKPFIDKPNDLPVLLESFKAPMPKKSGLSMFQDYKIIYVKKTGAVQSAYANRAYFQMRECNDSKNIAKNAIFKGFSGVREIQKGRYETKEMTVELNCLYKDTGRYPELELHIFHKQTNVK